MVFHESVRTFCTVFLIQNEPELQLWAKRKVNVKVYLSIQLGLSHKNMNSELFFITGNFSIAVLDHFHLKSLLWHRCHCLVTLQARSSLSLIYFHPHG